MTSDPVSPDVEDRELVELALRGHEPARSIELADARLRVDPHNATVLAIKGVALHQRGESVEAMATLVEASDAAGADIPIWERLAALVRKADLQEALLTTLVERASDGNGISSTWRTLGRAQRIFGHPTEAVNSFAKACSVDDGNAEAWFELAWATVDAGQSEQGLAAIARLVELDPDAAKLSGVLCFKALSLVRLGRTSEALDVLDQIEVTEGPLPAYAEAAYVEVAEALVNTGANEKARELLARAGTAIPAWVPGVRSRWLEGRALTGLGDFQGAVAAFKKAAELATDDVSRANILLGHAIALESSGELDDALEKFDEARKRFTTPEDHAAIDAMRGRVLRKLGRWKEAVEILTAVDRALLPPPDFVADLLMNYGLALSGLGQHKEGVEKLEEARQVAGGSALSVWIHVAKGRVLVKLGKWDEALSAFEAAHERLGQSPERGLVRLSQAEAAEELERPAEALAFADVSLAELGELAQTLDARVRALGVRARALQSLERDQEALETMERLAALRPSLQDDFDFLRRRCDLLLSTDRPNEALALLDRALQEDRPYAKHPYLRLMRAETARRLGGGMDEFVAQLKTLSVPSDYASDPLAWFVAAIAMATAQRWSEASDAFERLKQLDARWASLPLVRIFEAMTLNALGRYDQAVTRIQGLTEVPKRFAVTASVTEGQAVAGLERFAEAIAIFDRAITQADQIGGVDSLTLASALTGKANCLIRMKEFTEALPLFDAALKHSERDANQVGRLLGVSARTGKALAFHGLRQTSEALQVLDEAIPLAAALPPESPFRGLAWWTKAVVLTTIDREEDAVQAARRAERAGMPGNEALTTEADALLLLQDYAASLAAYESALTKARDDDQRFEALSGKGRALHRLQEFDKAVESYRKAIDLDCRSAKSDWLIWQRLGEAYDALERPKAALRAYQRGWALQGGGNRSVDLAMGVSAAWLNLGQPKEALCFLDQAQKLAKPDPRLSYNRGIALLRMKDVDAAKQAFRASGSEGLEAAADLLSKLDRKLGGQAAWTECWFGPSVSWGKRIVGGTLLLIVALVLAAPVTTFLLYGELDWKMLIAPPIVALLLLLLPTMRNVSLSVGDLKLQAEPSAPSVPEQAPDISKLTNVQPLLSGSAASAATYSSGVEEPVRQPADPVPFAGAFITAKVHP